MAFGVKLMSRNMGFDLGTANIVVYVDGKGIVLREPTMVAVRSDAKRQVLAVGDSGNDLGMLQYAGVRAAVGNAAAEFLALADLRLPDNEHDGVAWLLERLARGAL